MYMWIVIFFFYGKNVIVNLFVLDIDVWKCIFYEYVRFVLKILFLYICFYLFLFCIYYNM